MPTVEIKKRQVVVGTKKIPLISGEVHYWRLNPSLWEKTLAATKAMGLNIIATYVPWYYHEYQRGKFDFTGKTDPARNLKKFLELAKKKKFWVIIRPGPYIYSESPNDGVPDYAYKYHRLHPKFLQYAHEYMTRVCAVIKPFQATNRGGHIILLQADNEIDPWPDIFGQQYGFGKKPGLFQEFIKEKYNNDIDALNENWGSHYASFNETGPYIVHRIKGDKGLRRHLDYYEFKHYYSYKVGKWAVDEYRKIGITVPIYLNLYPFFYAHDWVKMQSVCDLTGIDLYPENELSVDANDHRKFMDKIRYTRTFSPIPYIAEFASGVWHNRHYESGVLSPNHYCLITLSAMAAGVCGWNWYMLVNRDNWYMSPISEWGRKRYELFNVFKDMVTVFNAIKPHECQKVTDISVTFIALQYAAKTVPQNGFILSSLYDADIDYEFFDCASGKISKKIIFYSGNHWLSKTGQQNLLEYVKKGGTLVCFRNYPRLDENFKEYNPFGFIDPPKILFEFKKQCTIEFSKRHVVETVSSIYSFNDVPGKPIWANVRDGSRHGTRHIIGYEKRIGKGKIVHIGVEPEKHVLFAVLRYYNINLYVHTTTADIKTCLLKRATKYYIIVLNNGNENKHAKLFITHPVFIQKSFTIKDIITNKKEVRGASKKPQFSIEIPRKNGAVLELSVSG